MKKFLNGMLVVVIAASLGAVQVSCSSDEDRNEIAKNSIKSVKEDHLEKNWIVAHFDFNESCKGAKKVAYQLSSVHISLQDNQFKAIDQYSLSEDDGSWVLEGDVIRVKSNKEGEEFQFKIKELKQNSLVVDVVNHPDLKGIELVSFDR